MATKAWDTPLYCLFALIDHADGELARMTNRCSARGQLYDRTVDLIVKIAVFSGMGTGLRHGPLGGWNVRIHRWCPQRVV